MSAAISVGRRVIWRGRSYVIEGVDPMSVTPLHVYLREDGTSDTIRIPLTEFERGSWSTDPRDV